MELADPRETEGVDEGDDTTALEDKASVEESTATLDKATEEITSLV